ncbi:unnamed protein product, partial [marine sediment metagenome]
DQNIIKLAKQNARRNFLYGHKRITFYTQGLRKPLPGNENNFDTIVINLPEGLYYMLSVLLKMYPGAQTIILGGSIEYKIIDKNADRNNIGLEQRNIETLLSHGFYFDKKIMLFPAGLNPTPFNSYILRKTSSPTDYFEAETDENKSTIKLKIAGFFIGLFFILSSVCEGAELLEGSVTNSSSFWPYIWTILAMGVGVVGVCAGGEGDKKDIEQESTEPEKLDTDLMKLLAEIEGENKVAIGKRIRLAREINGITRRELASESGVAVGTLRDWEIGECEPKPKRLKELARIFTVDVTYFLTGKGLDRAMREAETLGEKISLLRKINGLSKRELAAKTGVVETVVANWEND